MSPLITTELVALDADLGGEKADVIHRLAALVAGAGRATGAKALAADALAREGQAATGLPGGIAIPHCRSAAVTGEILLNGEDVLTMSWGRLRAVRWAGASIVFQGAMHSLNPVQRIGKQIAEPILLHEPDCTPAAAACVIGASSATEADDAAADRSFPAHRACRNGGGADP